MEIYIIGTFWFEMFTNNLVLIKYVFYNKIVLIILLLPYIQYLLKFEINTMNDFLIKFIDQIISKGKIIYKGNGKEIREYIHVKDAAKLSALVVSKKLKNNVISIFGQKKTSLWAP